MGYIVIATALATACASSAPPPAPEPEPCPEPKREVLVLFAQPIADAGVNEPERPDAKRTIY